MDIRKITVSDCLPLLEQFHGYGGAGKCATYAFGVYEDDALVAAYLWNPPPPGCAKTLSAGEPSAVLVLTRMVAVPKTMRRLKHVSKPLRAQMKRLIDRGRWPVLVTFSDQGQGHTGYVYQCSGWTQGPDVRRAYGTDADGVRRSTYSAGGRSTVQVAGYTTLTRWEHRVCDPGTEAAHMAAAGWVREPTGKVWRSGNPAFRWVQGAAQLVCHGTTRPRSP